MSQVLIPVSTSAIRIIITARHIKTAGSFYTKRSVDECYKDVGPVTIHL